MAKFKVDNEQIDATVETLKTLLKESEEIYEKEIPTSDVDKGQTHDELVTVCDNVRTTCYYFGQLIHNTIEFLGKSSEMFKMSDGKSADAIREDSSSSVTTPSTGATATGSNTNSVSLEINMGDYSLRQGDYPAFNEPYGYNAGCCAMAYTIGLSIVTGQTNDPTKYWYGGTTHYDDGHRGGWMSYDPNTIYNSLLEGKPTVLAYIYATSPADQTDADHFVVITGIREGADIDNLQYDDFVVVDPAYGTERSLSESWKFNPDRVTGGFVMY